MVARKRPADVKGFTQLQVDRTRSQSAQYFPSFFTRIFSRIYLGRLCGPTTTTKPVCSSPLPPRHPPAMHTDQLRQKDFIAALFSQEGQQPNPDPDFFNGQSFQNTPNIPEPLSSPSEQQNFPMQNNGNSNFLWEQQVKIQQLQQLHQLQQQIFQQQVRRRASEPYLCSPRLRRWKY